MKSQIEEVIKEQQEQADYLFKLMSKLIKINNKGADVAMSAKYVSPVSQMITSIHLILSTTVIAFKEDFDIMGKLDLNKPPKELHDLAEYITYYIDLVNLKRKQKGVDYGKNDKEEV